MAQKTMINSRHLPQLALVLPCYNEEEVLPLSLPKIVDKIQSLVKEKRIAANSFALFVDDGSRDATLQLLEQATVDYPNTICAVALAANVGHQNAMLAGLNLVRDSCDAAISIDADLQDDLVAIDLMLDKYRGGAEIVLGVRRQRKFDSFYKKFTARLYYRMLKWLGVRVVADHADFRLMTRRSLTNLSQFREVNLFLRAFPPMLHRRIEIVHYDRLDREAGETKYSTRKMMRLAWIGITSFSVVPLRFISLIGFLLFLFSLVAGFYVFLGIVRGHAVPGWASITLPLYLVSGLQMISIGLIGEYLAQIFLEVKARPRYLIDQLLNDRLL